MPLNVKLEDQITVNYLRFQNLEIAPVLLYRKIKKKYLLALEFYLFNISNFVRLKLKSLSQDRAR